MTSARTLLQALLTSIVIVLLYLFLSKSIQWIKGPFEGEPFEKSLSSVHTKEDPSEPLPKNNKYWSRIIYHKRMAETKLDELIKVANKTKDIQALQGLENIMSCSHIPAIRIPDDGTKMDTKSKILLRFKEKYFEKISIAEKDISHGMKKSESNSDGYKERFIKEMNETCAWIREYIDNTVITTERKCSSSSSSSSSKIDVSYDSKCKCNIDWKEDKLIDYFKKNSNGVDAILKHHLPEYKVYDKRLEPLDMPLSCSIREKINCADSDNTCFETNFKSKMDLKPDGDEKILSMNMESGLLCFHGVYKIFTPDLSMSTGEKRWKDREYYRDGEGTSFSYRDLTRETNEATGSSSSSWSLNPSHTIRVFNGTFELGNEQSGTIYWFLRYGNYIGGFYEFDRLIIIQLDVDSLLFGYILPSTLILSFVLLFITLERVFSKINDGNVPDKRFGSKFNGKKVILYYLVYDSNSEEYRNGDVRYMGEYCISKTTNSRDNDTIRMHGKGKCFYRDGSIYEGDFVQDMRHGFGVLSRPRNGGNGNGNSNSNGSANTNRGMVHDTFKGRFIYDEMEDERGISRDTKAIGAGNYFDIAAKGVSNGEHANRDFDEAFGKPSDGGEDGSWTSWIYRMKTRLEVLVGKKKKYGI